MDRETERLIREERLAEAAERLESQGFHSRAADLYERACDWSRAAEAARRAQDHSRVLRLAVESRDAALALAVLPRVAEDAQEATRVAHTFDRRGDHAWAARLFAATGQPALAAKAWERAGEAVEAARLLEEARDVVGAAKVLEAQIRREPTRHPLHIALGDLLLRYGKTEAAVRTLQKVPAGAPERRDALTLLLDGFERLGLAQAREEANAELSALGGPSSQEAPPVAQVEVKARLFGRYEVVREVAQSPSARVVECVDGVRQEHVAVKIFAAYDSRGAGRDALARFEREVKVLASLDHPNIVPLRDYVPEGPAIVLAWMSGGTLEAMLEAEVVAPARAVEIAVAVLSALGEAHRVGVLHRDVKPANVLFDSAGVTRLADFGVAHLGDLSATATAGVIGTLGYMSPEQREGRPATIQSDLYGVGAILWQMLTGQRPGAESAASGPASGPPSSSPRMRPSAAHRDLDPRHDALVLALMADEARERPEDAYAARKQLLSLPWPHTIERAHVRAEVAGPRSERPSPLARAQDTPDGGAVDTWLGRAIRRVPLDAASLERARGFAIAGHPALHVVWCVERAQQEIWLDEPAGEPLARPLGDREHAWMSEGLAALHAAGIVHGTIDRAHVRMTPQGPCLLFTARANPAATVDTDRLALHALASAPHA